jgi:hypothetical protein
VFRPYQAAGVAAKVADASSDLALLSTAIEEASRDGRSIYDQDQPVSNSLNLECISLDRRRA